MYHDLFKQFSIVGSLGCPNFFLLNILVNMCIEMFMHIFNYEIYRIEFLGKGYECFKGSSSGIPVFGVPTVMMLHMKT